jgi:hypothetical protein
MTKFIAGVWTTLCVFFVVYAINTKGTADLILGFAFLTVTSAIYGISIGNWIHKEDN